MVHSASHSIMDTNHSPRQGTPQDDSRTYLVGSIRGDNALTAACPHAQSLLCFSTAYRAEVICLLTCNRWGCIRCGPRKAKRLAYKIEKAEPNKLITLTINPKMYTSPREAYDKTRRQLPELSRLIKKAVGSFEYLRVLETTKAGWPHYHLMARCPYVPQKELSRLWAGLTAAPIVDVRSIKKIDNVFAYVVKYLCKQTYIEWTNRRTSWSRNFFAGETPYEGEPLHLTEFQVKKSHPVTTLDELYPGYAIQQITRTAFVLYRPDDDEPPCNHYLRLKEEIANENRNGQTPPHPANQTPREEVDQPNRIPPRTGNLPLRAGETFLRGDDGQ